jgi:hypothetical protein
MENLILLEKKNMIEGRSNPANLSFIKPIEETLGKVSPISNLSFVFCWILNSGLCACKANTPLELHLQTILVILEM